MWESGVNLRCQILSVQSQGYFVSVYGCQWECPGLVTDDVGVSRGVWTLEVRGSYCNNNEAIIIKLGSDIK